MVKWRYKQKYSTLGGKQGKKSDDAFFHQEQSVGDPPLNPHHKGT